VMRRFNGGVFCRTAYGHAESLTGGSSHRLLTLAEWFPMVADGC
jgi:hypothetical protein